MPRFKPVDQGPKLLPVDFDKQIQPGSFEHALCDLVDHELHLTAFHARDKNDDEGAPACDPAVLLKIILLAYSRGIISSRKIEAACREHVVCIAVSGDSQPHCTTLAAFVSERGDLAAKRLAQVLVVCDRQGLIGREMFAIAGVKLPSKASKAKSGSRKDFQRQAEKIEKAARKMLDKHRDADAAPQSRGVGPVVRRRCHFARRRPSARSPAGRRRASTHHACIAPAHSAPCTTLVGGHACVPAHARAAPSSPRSRALAAMGWR